MPAPGSTCRHALGHRRKPPLPSKVRQYRALASGRERLRWGGPPKAVGSPVRLHCTAAWSRPGARPFSPLRRRWRLGRAARGGRSVSLGGRRGPGLALRFACGPSLPLWGGPVPLVPAVVVGSALGGPLCSGIGGPPARLRAPGGRRFAPPGAAAVRLAALLPLFFLRRPPCRRSASPCRAQRRLSPPLFLIQW